MVGSGFKSELVRLMSLGKGHHFETQINWDASRKMMQNIARRVAAVLGVCVKTEAQFPKNAKHIHI